MEVTAKFEPNLKTERNLERLPDEVLKAVALQTLDFAYPTIPLSDRKNSGKLRLTSKEHGAQKGYGGYYIGSFTDYASYVWNMDNDRTHWTTKGTGSQWYARTLKKHGKTILNNAVNKAWKDNM